MGNCTLGGVHRIKWALSSYVYVVTCECSNVNSFFIFLKKYFDEACVLDMFIHMMICYMHVFINMLVVVVSM